MEGPDAQGNVVLTGSESPRVAVIAENLETGDIRGQRTGSDGRYEITIRAAVGDEMALYYQRGVETSDVTFFTIRGSSAVLDDGRGGSAGAAGEQQGAGAGGAGAGGAHPDGIAGASAGALDGG